MRGKVAISLAATAARMSGEQWAGYDAAPLLQAAGKLVSDNTPEARDAAKKLISLLRSAFDASAADAPAAAATAAAADAETEVAHAEPMLHSSNDFPMLQNHLMICVLVMLAGLDG